MTQHSTPLQYIKRTKHYYEKLGYGNPYEWANYQATPFTPLLKPINECKVAIVTTAAPYQENKGDQGPGAPYNASAKFFTVFAGSNAALPDLRISHIAIDRDHTSATDLGTYFPLKALKKAADDQLIGELGPRFYGLPTNRSKRTTIETDCPQILSLCKQDSVDIVLLVPNCPVCHQSVSLAARTLEAAGIVTVVMGCAKDIVEHVGVPRFLFSDFPLGNAAGRPHDDKCQSHTLTLALDLAAKASQTNTTAVSPYQWLGKTNWKDDYSNPDKLTQEEIKQRRSAFDAAKVAARAATNRAI